MTELLERVMENSFDAVVVMDIDRLSRDDYGAAKIKRILFSTGTYIVTPSKMYDPSKDEDNLLLGIQSLVASQEYKQILKRMQQGKKFAINQGHWVNGIPPLGFDKDPKTKKLVPNERAEDIKYIFNSIVKGKTVSDVYNELNKLGIKTKTNSKFAFNSIVRIVQNEAYKGSITMNRYEGRYKYKPKEHWIVVPKSHPAIVDENTWEKANKIVNTYSFSAPRSKNRIYPTTKLIFCGNCGRVQGCQFHKHINKLYVKICRHCKNRSYPYRPVVQKVKDELVTYRQDVLNAISDVQQVDNSQDKDYKRKQLESQIRTATQALGQIELLFEEMEIDLQQYRERKAKRKQQIEQLTAELEQLEQETPQDKIAELSEVLEQVDYLLGKWEFLDGEGLTDEQVNRALHLIIDRVEWLYGKDDEGPTMKFHWKV